MNENSVTKSFILGIIFAFCFALFLYFARGILAPFIISAFLAYIISPLVNKIMLLGIKRWVAVVILIAVFCMFMVFAISVIIPVLNEDINIFIKKIPEYEAYIKDVLAKLQQYFDKVMPFIKKYNIIENLTAKTTALITNEAAKIPGRLMDLVSAISIIGLVPVLTFFMLLGYDKTPKSIVQLVPSKYVELLISIFHEVNFVLGGYIRGQIIEVFFVATCAVLSLSVIGVNYALLIGVTSGLCNLIPYLGPAVGFILGVIVAAVQFQALVPVVEVAICFIIIQQLDNNIIQPIVIGQNVNLSPVMMMFALLAGANIFGFIGMILAVPVMALLKNICIMFITRYKKIY